MSYTYDYDCGVNKNDMQRNCIFCGLLNRFSPCTLYILYTSIYLSISIFC